MLPGIQKLRRGMIIPPELRSGVLELKEGEFPQTHVNDCIAVLREFQGDVQKCVNYLKYRGDIQAQSLEETLNDQRSLGIEK